MTVAYVSHSDCGRHDTGWGHPEHVGRLRAIPRALAGDEALYHTLLHVEGRRATVEDVALVHDRAYIETVRRIAAAGGGALDADTVCSEGSWDAALAAYGAVRPEHCRRVLTTARAWGEFWHHDGEKRQWRNRVTLRALRELHKVHAGGAEVTMLGPGEEDLEAIGANLMDVSRRPGVIATSLRTSAAALHDPAPLPHSSDFEDVG